MDLSVRPTFVLLILNVGLVGAALLCVMDKDSEKDRMLVYLRKVRGCWFWPHFRRSALVFCNRSSSSFFVVLFGFFSIPIGQLPDSVRDILRNSILCVWYRCNNWYLRKRFKIRCFYLLDDRDLPVPFGWGFTVIELVPRWLQTLSAFIPNA